MGIRGQREAGSTTFFCSRRFRKLDTCYQREVRPTDVGIRGPGGRRLYAINIEGCTNRTIDIYAENRGRSISGIRYQREAGSTTNIHRRFSVLDTCRQREARPTSVPLPERSRSEASVLAAMFELAAYCSAEPAARVSERKGAQPVVYNFSCVVL